MGYEAGFVESGFGSGQFDLATLAFATLIGLCPNIAVLELMEAGASAKPFPSWSLGTRRVYLTRLRIAILQNAATNPEI
jgi:hypothetical protein